MALVKNIDGTAERQPLQKESWREFWASKVGRDFPKHCKRSGCTEIAEVSAHVQKNQAESGDHWYIAPLCKKCRAQDTVFLVNDEYLARVTKND